MARKVYIRSKPKLTNKPHRCELLKNIFLVAAGFIICLLYLEMSNEEVAEEEANPSIVPSTAQQPHIRRSGAEAKRKRKSEIVKNLRAIAAQFIPAAEPARISSTGAPTVHRPSPTSAPSTVSMPTEAPTESLDDAEDDDADAVQDGAAIPVISAVARKSKVSKSKGSKSKVSTSNGDILYYDKKSKVSVDTQLAADFAALKSALATVSTTPVVSVVARKSKVPVDMQLAADFAALRTGVWDGSLALKDEALASYKQNKTGSIIVFYHVTFR
jgi:hypothetical protein